MRHAKQFVYGIFFLILWIAIAAGIYFIFVKPAPTCFDGLQNQDERGVDCGGACAKVCRPNVQDLSASQVSAFLLSTNASSTRASLLAQVTNPNPDFAASFAYTFNVYDAAKNKLGSFSGSSYIYAAEIKYIALPNVEIPSVILSEAKDLLLTAELTIEEPAWIKQDDFKRPEVVASLARTDTEPTLVARGTVANNEPVSVNAEVIAVFYDAAQKPVGVSATSLDGLKGAEIREFAIFHPAIEGVAPERTRVFVSAYTVK